MKRTKRIAFTLIELIASIAIIAIMLAMLLPAVQRTRASARTMACLSNARQIAMASQMFHDSFRKLPTEPLMLDSDAGWSYDILHYLEQDELRKGFDPSLTVDADQNIQLASRFRPQALTCPENLDVPVTMLSASGSPFEVKASHYLFNGFVLGQRLSAIPETDMTMLARDASLTSSAWHSSPFTSVWSDDPTPSHPGGTVVVFVSGRVAVVQESSEVVIAIDR
ncbi:DUF1559 family PulG-like putative transporter [Aporhodopirellula aestuarii]|uniref:DUF1559 domain-containing protein n=1 Tax=Aporhodopirellula aestuarii TaxID=2950107 RepID=A0ABT0UCV4_9BACT|nr:DUF1559 domain-containing protein [Aporhodopirellula aestuarii]MCM2374574.1 DUF1559 domain-containing protein [Aporhodopirellula aestuarii]